MTLCQSALHQGTYLESNRIHCPSVKLLTLVCTVCWVRNHGLALPSSAMFRLVRGHGLATVIVLAAADAAATEVVSG